MSKRFGMRGSVAKENTSTAKEGIFIVHNPQQILRTLSEAYFRTRFVFC